MSILESLKKGNEKFVKNGGLKVISPEPKAIVICCFDPRFINIWRYFGLSPDDGELIMITSAGGSLGKVGIGSAEFALGHFPTVDLIVVLGHEDCGATKTTIKRESHKGNVPDVLRKIEQSGIESTADQTTRKHVEQGVKKLLRSPIINGLSVKVVGAMLQTNGKIDWM